MPYVIIHDRAPGMANDWLRLGTDSHLAQKYPDAERQYVECLKLAPDHAVAMNNLAVLNVHAGHLSEGLLWIERASMVIPQAHAAADAVQINWILMLLDQEQFDAALRKAQWLHEAKPSFESRQVMAMALSMAGRPGETAALYLEILKEQPSHPAAGANACFVQSLLDLTPRDLLPPRQAWHSAHGFKGEKKPHFNDRNLERPLRVGYVGGDFKQHSAAYIFGAVVLFHDRKKVEPYCYSSLPVDPKADALTSKFQKQTNWRDISSLNDEQAAAMICEDKIDILVDLAAHSNGGRLSLFTRKPAPVQVTAWGFAHGTGLPEMDWFFGDKVALPPNEREWYTERIWDLPCIVTYAGPEHESLNPVTPAPCWCNGYVTFGAFCRFEKMSAEYLETCAKILSETPGSRLLFKDASFRRPYAVRRVLEAMPGVEDKSRLLFLSITTHEEHLRLFSKVDLFLDPWPHSGGVGSLEQLWMGVPVVTLYGRQPAGRITASVLKAIGHSEWIAKDRAEYARIACHLVQGPNFRTLTDARRTLHQQLTSSPIMEGYVEAVEAAYRQMFEIWAGPVPVILGPVQEESIHALAASP